MHFKTLMENDEELVLVALLPEGAPVFAGHFPGLPIVPGVVQVQWAMTHSQRWYCAKQFWRLDKLKFHQVVIPGDTVTLSLKHLGDGKVAFNLQTGDITLSSGCLVFRV